MIRAFSSSTVGTRGAAVMLAKCVLGEVRPEEVEAGGDEKEDRREGDDDDGAAALSGSKDGAEKRRYG